MNEARSGGDALFILLGAIMVLAMHGGFAFLELGTVRAKNQVNALVKIMVDFAVSTVAYFFVGYAVAYGVHFFTGHGCHELEPDVDWQVLANEDKTLVIYMGLTNIKIIVKPKY